MTCLRDFTEIFFCKEEIAVTTTVGADKPITVALSSTTYVFGNLILTTTPLSEPSL